MAVRAIGGWVLALAFALAWRGEVRARVRAEKWGESVAEEARAMLEEVAAGLRMDMSGGGAAGVGALDGER